MRDLGNGKEMTRQELRHIVLSELLLFFNVIPILEHLHVDELLPKKITRASDKSGIVKLSPSNSFLNYFIYPFI